MNTNDRARRGRLGVCGLTVALAVTALGRSEAETQLRESPPPTGLVKVVREATQQLQDPAAAMAAGYQPVNGCVSGPNEGAMGVHFVKGDLVGDGRLDPRQPEALIFEPTSHGLRLAGVEYIVLADAWNASNQGPPVLLGHLAHHAGSPNRYGLPAFYELHVWAWKHNPRGVFSDWHPRVSCARYVPDEAGPAAASHSHLPVPPKAGSAKAASSGTER